MRALAVRALARDARAHVIERSAVALGFSASLGLAALVAVAFADLAASLLHVAGRLLHQ